MIAKPEEIQTLGLLYEGKGKKLFLTDHPGILFMEFKNDLTAFNAQKRGSFEGKGLLAFKISNFIFEFLKKAGIPTHWVAQLESREGRSAGNLVKRIKMIPLEFVVRNRWAGSTAKKLGIRDGNALSKPLFELYLKNDALGDPFVSSEQVEALELIKKERLIKIRELALRINDLMKDLFRSANLELVDFKLEFGETNEGEILLGDEISPDSCRLWDIRDEAEARGEFLKPRRLDKDVFRLDLGSVSEAYQEVWERLQKIGIK
jgi:phosphoribosylaminoimidazole-succinocarboxamide synthase